MQKIFFMFVVMAMLLAACQPASSPPLTPVATDTSALPATGGPSVIVRDQESDGRTIVIERVVSDGPGWVAVHSVEGGTIGSDIGRTHVNTGEQSNVIVNLDPGKTTQEMVAMLHIDSGQENVYEFPGPDEPAAPPAGADSSVVAPRFRVTLSQQGAAATASGTYILEVADQDIVNGVVKISRVVSDKNVWVAIQDDHGGQPGDVVGQRLVEAGEWSDVEVTIDPTHQRSSLLYAILYEDANQDGRFEGPTKTNPNAPDIPLTVNGATVQTTFTHLGMAVAEGTPHAPEGSEAPQSTEMAHGETETTPELTPAPMQDLTPVSFCLAPAAPPEGVILGVQASDQEIKEGAILIDSVVSAGPGWVAIWTQPPTGEPKVIGFQPVQAGENRNVSVPVEAGQATPRLSAVLHLDGGQQGLFETDKDCAARVGFRIISFEFNASGTTSQAQATQPAPVDFRVVADDQPLRGGDTLVIAEVVSDGPGWIGIHLSEPNGELSHTAAIGAGQLKNGLNTNVVVKINRPERATDKVWGMLHYDREPLGEYNFPNAPGNDTPVKVNGADVVDGFLITGGKAGQQVVLKVASGAETSFLADSQGFSLYTPTTGDCVDVECLKVWRPLVVTGALELGEGVNGLKVSVRGLSDGSRQLMYAGLPLYYYIGDSKPGETNGHLQEGGRWVLAPP